MRAALRFLRRFSVMRASQRGKLPPLSSSWRLSGDS
jgi:hypothetical protein